MTLWLLFLFLHFAYGAEDSDVISEVAFEKSLEREASSSNMRPTEAINADEQANVRNSRGTEASSEITGTSRLHKKKKTVRRRVTKQDRNSIRGRPRHRPTPRDKISAPQHEKEIQVRNRRKPSHSGSALRQTSSPAPRKKKNSHRFNRLRGQILSSTASIDDTPISTTPLTTTTGKVTERPSTVPSRPMNKSKEEVMHKKNLQSSTSSERFSTGQIRSEKRPPSRRIKKLLRPTVFHTVENVTESAFILTEVSNEHEREVQKNRDSTLGTTKTSTTTKTTTERSSRARSTTPRTTKKTTTKVTTELSTSSAEETTTAVTRTTPETTVSGSTSTTTTPLPNTSVSENTTTPTTSSTTRTPVPSTIVGTTKTTTEIRIGTIETSTTPQLTTSTAIRIFTTAEDSTTDVSSLATSALPTSMVTTLAPLPRPRTLLRAKVPAVVGSAERISDEIERNLIKGNQGPCPPVENSTNTVDLGPLRVPPRMVPAGVRVPETGPPGAAPLSDTIVNLLNQADDFMEVSRQLWIALQKKTVARRKRSAERDRFIFNLTRSRSF